MKYVFVGVYIHYTIYYIKPPVAFSTVLATTSVLISLYRPSAKIVPCYRRSPDVLVSNFIVKWFY